MGCFNSKANNEAIICSICLKPILFHDIKYTLSCSHTFHLNCIFEWLKVSATCPYCRSAI